MHFAGSFPKENITYENSVSADALKVVVLAVVPDTELPLRDSEGNVIATVRATEDLIRGAVSTFKGGIFNVDHMGIPETMIGVFDSAIYDEGFKVSGSILCPQWKEKIQSGNFSGVSIEGDIFGEISNPDSIEIKAISFLSHERNPAGGACPLKDLEGKSVCNVEIIEDDGSIEAAWDGSAAEKQIWGYATDESGTVIPSKAKKCFLKVEGDPTKKGSYSYPYVTIVSGKPVPNREGLVAALKFASGAMGATKDQTLIRKIKTIMSRNGMDLPPSLQARLEQKSTIENGQHVIVASVLDPATDEILDSQKIIVINDSTIQGEQMTEINEPGTPPDKVLDWSLVSKELGISSKDEFMTIKASADKVPSLEKQIGEIIEENKTLKAANASPEKVLDWDLVSQEIGIKSKDEFTSIKDIADKVPSLEQKIGDILKETESLKSFKVETEKKWLADTYPPAVTKDIAATHAEFVKDPAGFVQKYAEDAVKFAASKSVKLQGSAAESELTEEAKKMKARIEKRDGFLKSTGGPVIR